MATCQLSRGGSFAAMAAEMSPKHSDGTPHIHHNLFLAPKFNILCSSDRRTCSLLRPGAPSNIASNCRSSRKLEAPPNKKGCLTTEAKVWFAPSISHSQPRKSPREDGGGARRSCNQLIGPKGPTGNKWGIFWTGECRPIISCSEC